MNETISRGRKGKHVDPHTAAFRVTKRLVKQKVYFSFSFPFFSPALLRQIYTTHAHFLLFPRPPAEMIICEDQPLSGLYYLWLESYSVVFLNISLFVWHRVFTFLANLFFGGSFSPRMRKSGGLQGVSALRLLYFDIFHYFPEKEYVVFSSTYLKLNTQEEELLKENQRKEEKTFYLFENVFLFY